MLCIYHAGCMDGFAAAWVVEHYCRTNGIPFVGHAAAYGSEPPWELIDGQDVIIADFSYTHGLCEDISRNAKSLRIFDHHKTAAAELGGLSYVVFDMNRSGCGIAWDELFTRESRPWFVNYVEDRDLWRFALPSCKEVNLYLSNCEKNYDVFRELMTEPWTAAVAAGSLLQTYHNNRVQSLVAEARIQVVGGVNAAVVNCPHYFASDVGDNLGTNYPLAILWSQDRNGLYRYSARSASGFDCADFAKQYGGGGHKGAAGFSSKVQLW